MVEEYALIIVQVIFFQNDQYHYRRTFPYVNVESKILNGSRKHQSVLSIQKIVSVWVLGDINEILAIFWIYKFDKCLNIICIKFVFYSLICLHE